MDSLPIVDRGWIRRLLGLTFHHYLTFFSPKETSYNVFRLYQNKDEPPFPTRLLPNNHLIVA